MRSFPLNSISIHTPTRGVTYLPILETLPGRKFQSTLPQGEWLRWIRHHSSRHIISIHTPTRGVTAYYCINHYTSVISIHTPTRGVTWEMKYLVIKSIFQSTLPQGEWLDVAPFLHVQSLFQSTLPQGEWPLIIIVSMLVTDFNPHSHKGSDDLCLI